MSTNFSVYYEKLQPMRTSDLTVGDTVIRVIRPRNDWDEFRTIEYVVKKVLTTRVVFEAKGETGTTGRKHEVRLIVNTSKWSSNKGAVTSGIEGGSDSWNRSSYDFVTADETDLLERLRKMYAARNKAHQTKQAATAAIRDISGKLNPNLESVEAAIVALQELAAQMRAEAN